MAREKHGTAIGWTHWTDSKGETWTVVRGCQLAKYKTPDGKPKPFKTCVGCYAMATAHSLVTRFDMPQYRDLTIQTSSGPVWNGNVFFDEEQLLWPFRCTKPRTFFLTSMGDIAYEGVTDDQIARVIAVMMVTKRHRYLVLTKRPDRVARLLKDREFSEQVEYHIISQGFDPADCDGRNIWWGTSIEDQASADWALPYLTMINAADRLWISYEPAIEYARLHKWIHKLSWIIVGGASTQRGVVWKFDTSILRNLFELAEKNGVPVYVKQLGSTPCVGTMPITISGHDNHNAEPKNWPQWMRVQQFPNAPL